MKITIIIILLALSACATPYQKTGYTGGFSETQLSENMFKVSFKGNGYTGKERASDFTLLRSAELALENGFKYFEIADNQSSTNTEFYTTPVTAHTTGYANTTGMLNTYGNTGMYNGSTFGNSTTTYSGGETYSYSKPQEASTIICYKKKPKDKKFLLDAAFVRNSIRKKYNLDSQGGN